MCKINNYTLDDKVFFTNKYIFNNNIIKKEVNTVTNRALSNLVCLCALGIIFFSNKAKVTLILHTAHSENDMNMTVGKSIKRSII